MMNVVAIGAVTFWILMGIRGWGRVDIDYFAQHPFISPLVQCDVEVLDANGNVMQIDPHDEETQLLLLSIQKIPYLETLRLNKERIEQHLQKNYPGADVQVRCVQLYGEHHIFPQI